MKRFLARLAAVIALAAVGAILAVWMPRIATGDDGATVSDTVTTAATSTAPALPIGPPPIVVVIKPRYHGHNAQWWHAAYTAQQHRTRTLKRTLLRQPTVTEALNLACTVYGNCATLWRRARCESKLYRFAANRGSSARGLLQFLTTGWVRRYGDHARVDGGTWATTPFWRFSPFSAYANALAAGWMIGPAHRSTEWACR